MSCAIVTPGDADESAQPSQWRSATAHDVYADNRDEDIFGWIQPDEWDTVAGVNKNNFLRGDCIECNAGPNTAVESCGGPSCGYGAQCCEYSRRGTSTNFAPARSLSASAPETRNLTIPDMAKNEQKNSLGVSLIDIIHGRSCRPISLLDLRTFLHFQRDPRKRLAAYSPASEMQSSAIDDLDLNLGDTFAPTPSIKPASNSTSTSFHDEVDALDFLVAYERYVTKFREQPRSARLQSPDPLTCKAAVRAYVRRQHKIRTSSDLTAVEARLQNEAVGSPPDSGTVPPEPPSEITQEILANLKPTDLGLKPDTQPLRVEFDQLVRRYLCNQRHCIPDSRKTAVHLGFFRKDHAGSSSETVNVTDLSDKEKLPTKLEMPRVRWMLDVGLISEEVLQLALAECDFSNHPDVLAPVAEAVYAYMSQHVVPYFFISVAKNLSPHTKRGRLMVGATCTAIALLFSILLIVKPSPLAPQADDGTGDINRWWRLTTAPLWCAGLGYILAYFTGLCVWLTLRGNREPDEEEERERGEIRSRVSSDDVMGFDLSVLQADVDLRNTEIERETNRWMAPELADLLNNIAGQKKRDKQRHRKSMADGDELRSTEEGLQLTVSRSEKDVFKNNEQAPRRSESNQATRPSLGRASSKQNAPATPAAVILNTPRRRAISVASDHAVGSRSAPTHTSVDLKRPSIDEYSKIGSATMSDPRVNEIVTSPIPNVSTSTSIVKHKKVPLLNFSFGMVTSTSSEDPTSSVVLTRDALLFDPELANQLVSPPRASADLGMQVSPPADRPRRSSVANVILPAFKSSGRSKQTSFLGDTAEEAVDTANPDPTIDSAKVLKVPPPAAVDVAPWSAPPPGKKSSDLPAATRSLLFSPSSNKSRPAVGSGNGSMAASKNMRTLPGRSYRHSSRGEPLKARFWKAVQRGTGFAVGTERVLDSRVRHAQQMKALRIMAMNTAATLVVMVIVLVIP